MKRRLWIALLLGLVGMASPAQAIELFTNFNNGTELGTRPYGISDMPPVRYHWWQKGYCPPPAMEMSMPERMGPSTGNVRLPNDGPVRVQPDSAATRNGHRAANESILPNANFLPADAKD